MRPIRRHSAMTAAVAVLCCIGSLAILLGVVTLGTWAAVSALAGI